MERATYPSDLTNEQSAALEPLIPPAKPGGWPRTVDIREIINSLNYPVRTWCAWRYLPHDLPPWGTVHSYLWHWQRDGAWQAIHDALRTQVRQSIGKEASSSAAIGDSQSVKTTEKRGPRGFDAGKKVVGRKRHLVVDTLGLALAVVVHAASIQDRDGAKFVLAKLVGTFPRLQKIWADGGYAGQLIAWVQALAGWVLEIVKCSDDVAGFEVVPKRWIVERTLAWLGKYRRLSKDDEAKTQTSETMIHLAMIHLMVRRLKPP